MTALHRWRESGPSTISISPSMGVKSRLLDELLQTVERFVPPLRDMVEIAPRCFDLFRLERPDPLSAAPPVRDQPSGGEHVQVLRNGLSRDSRPGGQPLYRQRPIGAQLGHERE